MSGSYGSPWRSGLAWYLPSRASTGRWSPSASPVLYRAGEDRGDVLLADRARAGGQQALLLHRAGHQVGDVRLGVADGADAVRDLDIAHQADDRGRELLARVVLLALVRGQQGGRPEVPLGRRGG